ncbi:MAG: hexokinase [Clostridia bacterium]|nr:hexokinase [Clostridia bacterium]
MSYSDKTRAFLSRHGMAPENVDIGTTVSAFLGDMAAGLAGRKSSLRMIPAYLSADGQLPLGVPAAVIDAGGTNFRTALVTFTESGAETSRFSLARMPGSDAPVSWDEFISFTALRVLPLLEKAGTIGFCFSYPTEETPEKDGRLLTMTKQVDIKGFEGRLICADLKARLAELGAGERSITLLNDTPAVLLSGASMLRSGDYDGFIGLICGTGTNTCCEMPVFRIPKLGGGIEGRMLVNLESGGFSGLPRGDYDEELDNATADPGIYRLEKMTSGAYIGELCRRSLHGAARDGLFSAKAAGSFLSLDALSAPQADRLASGAGHDLISGSEGDFDLASEICRALFDRAARCVAASLFAIMTFTGSGRDPGRPACICADGAMFKKSQAFRPALEMYIEEFAAAEPGLYAAFHTAENATIIGSAAAALLNI